MCCTEKDLFLHLLILSITENYETVMSSVLPMDIVDNHPGEGEQGNRIVNMYLEDIIVVSLLCG